MRLKKGQVMIFVIMGMVVLLIFGFLYSFISSLKKEGLESQQEEKARALKIKNEFKNYVGSCFDNAAKEGLLLVGRQGGVIYDYQADNAARYRGPPKRPYGEYILPFLDKQEDVIYNVSYGITKPSFDETHPSPPLYPYGPTKLVEDPTKYSSSYVNVLGNYPPPGPFVPLCDYNGRNAPGKASIAHSCETYDSRNAFIHNSLQEYLEFYVENKTTACVKQNAFRALNSTVNVTNVNASVMFSNEKVYFDLDFPAKIHTEGEIINSDFKRFSIVVENRLKLVHELASRLIKEDVNNIFFDIVKDAYTLNSCREWGRDGKVCLKEGMTIEKIRNHCKKTEELNCPSGADYDDLLVIRDQDSFLYGEPFEFYFAIENRPPALDLILQQKGKVGFMYDFVSFVGDEILIEPKAYDPDESFHGNNRYMQKGYDYGMWKEDYDEAYNKFFCSVNPEECISDPGGKATVKQPSYKPNAWSSSSEFEKTERAANYVTQKKDWGAHEVKVKACDDEGLCDYQKVTIFVGNIFENQSFNPYSDISNNFASIEDPYTIVFPKVDSGSEPAKYEIKLDSPSGENILTQKDSERFLNIPLVDTIGELSPSELRNKVEEVFSDKGVYNIGFESFDASDNLLYSSDNNELEVKECLPHDSENPPYPFTKENYLQADHACCLGDENNPSGSFWGTFADSSTVCYSKKTEGCFANFSVPEGVDYSLPSPPTGMDAKDVYEFDLEVKCSGNEGVSCTGDTSGSVEKIQECGPCQTCKAGSSECINMPSYDFVCNPSYECSLGEFKQYNVGGNYSCQAACDEEGKCNIAINCSCDAQHCSAECDDGWYQWVGNVCNFNCSNNCAFQEKDSTICSAPSSPSNSYDFGSGSILLGEESVGSILQNDIEFDDTNYGSVCVHNNKCHVSSCYEDGVGEYEGDDCYPPGVAQGERCYTSPGPECNLDAECTSYDVLSFYGNNPSGNTCYYNITCLDSGWDYEIDTSKPSGHYKDGGKCYYGSFCHSSEGWKKHSDSTKPSPSASGGVCHYGSSCTNSGWSYASSDSTQVPDCTNKCTNTGWKCI
ncbi:MAG: hypothetical protein ACQESF_00165 [Nanobdellota archaeon]